MAELTTWKCIKPSCGKEYQSADAEAYYCESCLEEKKAVASAVDARIGSRPRKEIKSELKVYDEISRSQGGKFPNIKSLGIEL